jgi:hypothetical protein
MAQTLFTLAGVAITLAILHYACKQTHNRSGAMN